MRNWIKRLSVIALAVLMVSCLCAPAFAAGNAVSYQNGRVLVFSPGSAYAGSDVFGEMKALLPGDVRTANLSFENKATDCDYINVYLQAVPHDGSGNPVSPEVLAELQNDSRRGSTDELAYMYDFLSLLHVQVRKGSALLSTDTADQAGGLEQPVYLGSLKQGQRLDLAIDLQVPVSLDNSYCNRIGEVDWRFIVEGFTSRVFTARVVWDDGNSADRPQGLDFTLRRNGIEFDTVELNAENQWTYTWQTLDSDQQWDVITTADPAGYTVSYDTTIPNTVIFKYTKPAAPKPGQPFDLTVTKLWSDRNAANRPSSVKITLFDGTEAVDTVTLSAANNWTHVWQSLDGGGSWQVQEVEIASGYVPSYRAAGNRVTITNSRGMIQTGQLKWPVPVMALLGIVLILWGIILLKKKRKDEHA